MHLYYYDYNIQDGKPYRKDDNSDEVLRDKSKKGSKKK